MKTIVLFFLILINASLHANTDTFCEPIKNIVLPKSIETPIENTFVFDPNHLQWAVYDKKGTRVGVGKAVGGKDFCNDIKDSCRTVEGTYSVFRKENEECVSNTFPIEKGGAPMPHCMFFHKGYAIHGSLNLPDKNASHGCIRVSKRAAEWMNKNYVEVGSTVVVLAYNSSDAVKFN